MALGGMVKAITHPVTMECCGLDMKSNTSWLCASKDASAYGDDVSLIRK